MQDRRRISSGRARVAFLVGCAALACGLPRSASAQYNAPPLSGLAVGERYHVELGGTIWNPMLMGTISSEQFKIVGSTIDLVNDLGFEQTRLKELRLVLRPARKHRVKVQYTPISYTATTNFTRVIKFNGINFPAAIPIATAFDWKVLRFGYEYDMVYRDRGFFGVFVEGRYTEFLGSLKSASPLFVGSEFTEAKAPLPALGVSGRAYVAPNVALNLEVSGFNVPGTIKKGYAANYYDWDIHGTVNVTNNFGIQVGWRRMTTFLEVDNDKADFRFQGMWFGAAARF